MIKGIRLDQTSKDSPLDLFLQTDSAHLGQQRTWAFGAKVFMIAALEELLRLNLKSK